MSGRASLFWILASIHLTACQPGSNPGPVEGTSADPFLALIHGQLIDGTGADPLPDATILIERETIAAVGTFASVSIPPGVPVINLDGATVLPGFINAHVHRGYEQSNLEAWAREGVTTIRDLGANPDRPLFDMRDSLNQDSACARLVAAGPLVTVPNGYPMVPWGASSGLPVTSPDDAREKIGELLDRGADIIKIAVERGGSFGRTIPSLSPDEIDAIVEVAHSRGTKVSAHVLVSADLARALAADVDDIAHMVTDDLPDALIDDMVSRDVFWVPTLELWHGVGYGLGEVAMANLRRFVDAGGKVALGTDFAGYSSTFDLGMPIREIRWMRDAGMAGMQIIVAATQHAATVCNGDNLFGTIEAGKIADLLVVRGDPLEDLETLLEVRMVVRAGVVIRSD